MTVKYATAILAAAIALAMVVAFRAEAAPLETHKEMLGVWCSSDQPGEYDPFARSNDQQSCRKQSNKTAANKITIKPGEYIYQYEPNTPDGYTYTCTYRVIKNRLYPDIDKVAIVAADCKEQARPLHVARAHDVLGFRRRLNHRSKMVRAQRQRTLRAGRMMATT
jgi:hypothetical protein